jgi:hypothetical protein
MSLDHSAASTPPVESLEPRAYLTADAASFNVDGTEGPDQISIHAVGGVVTVTVNGVPSSELDMLVTQVVVNAKGGNDTIRLERNTDNNVQINAGDGDDTVTLTDDAGSLSSLGDVTRNIVVNGDAGGADAVVLDDSARSENASYAINPLAPGAASVAVNDSTALTPLAPTVSTTGFEHLALAAGEGDDQIVVPADVIGMNMSIDAGLGADKIDVRGDGGSAALPVVVDGNAGLDDLTISASAGDMTVVTAPGSQDWDALRVDPDSTLQIGGQLGDVHTLRDAMLSAAGRLDVGRATVAVDYPAAGPSPIGTIRSRITSGHAGGAWNGNGIASSAAATTPGTAVGYAEFSDVGPITPPDGGGPPLVFDQTTVVIRFTLSGDANLNRVVNISDFARLAANFNLPGDWAKGDANYDTATNVNDFSLLAGNFNRTLVPQPPKARTLWSVRRLIDDVG